MKKDQEPCSSVFTAVYDAGKWGFNEDGSSSSGWGSQVQYAKPYLEFLIDFLKKNEIKSVLDAGCGDWTLSRTIDWGGIEYCGIDVVKSLVEKNQKLFSKPNIRFMHGDLIEMKFPDSQLLLCKDVLQHLTNSDVRRFLKKIRGFKHCLITNDIVEGDKILGDKNRDLKARGKNRPLDLTLPPFKIKGEKVLTYSVGDHTKQVLHIHNG